MELLTTNIRGRHVAPEGRFVSRINPENTKMFLFAVNENSICLRIDDEKNLDFWIEFDLNITTLETLLQKAKHANHNNINQ